MAPFLSHAAAFPQLTALHLGRLVDADAVADTLQNLTSLHTLGMFRTRVTRLPPMPLLHALTQLDLHDDTDSLPECAELLHSLPALGALHMTSARPAVADAMVDAIAAKPALLNVELLHVRALFLFEGCFWLRTRKSCMCELAAHMNHLGTVAAHVNTCRLAASCLG